MHRIAEPRLIGTWHLLSLELRAAGGDPSWPMGREAIGQIVYDAGGNMSAHLADPTLTLSAELPVGGIAGRYTSYYGPYDVDPAARTVTHRLVAASIPGWAGTTLVRDYAFDGDDRLTLSADADGRRAILRWRRAC